MGDTPRNVGFVAKRPLDKRLEPFMEELRDLLYEKRASQAHVERAAGMPSKYLSKLLGGAVEMKLVHLYDVLDVVEVDPEEFFARLAHQPAPSAEELSVLVARLQAMLAATAAVPDGSTTKASSPKGQDTSGSRGRR